MRRAMLVGIVLMMLLALPLPGGCDAPLPTDPMAIRNELRALRKKSADNDPAVRARIDALMKQLQKLQSERDAAESQARGEAKPVEEGEAATTTGDKMYQQVMDTAAKGKGAELDLAEPVREKITEQYEEDRDRTIKNPLYYEVQTVLVIDLSLKEAPALIDVMDKFTGITTLVLTGGANGAPVDLPRILNKARKMPLTELYIFNFRSFLSAVPESVGAFTGLTRLSLFNNNIKELPAAVGSMKQLKVLQVDVNPITTLLPTVKELVLLEELGIGKTGISPAEQTRLVQLLPNCKVMTK